MHIPKYIPLNINLYIWYWGNWQNIIQAVQAQYQPNTNLNNLQFMPQKPDMDRCKNEMLLYYRLIIHQIGINTPTVEWKFDTAMDINRGRSILLSPKLNLLHFLEVLWKSRYISKVPSNELTSLKDKEILKQIHVELLDMSLFSRFNIFQHVLILTYLICIGLHYKDLVKFLNYSLQWFFKLLQKILKETQVNFLKLKKP